MKTFDPEQEAPVQVSMADAPHLFSPLTLREITVRNRVMISPMCQYSSDDGMASDWHLVHLGSRAVGGAGLVMTEATAVTPEGRISPQDLGIWSDRHVEGLARIARFLTEQGAVPAIQLAHAGRKASTYRPWDGGGPLRAEDNPWPTLAPSAIPFAPHYPTPREMSEQDIVATVDAFVAATQRALAAGFEVVEIHAAHGYLIHEFLSPLSNRRADNYGGAFDNRVRFAREIVRAVRRVWPRRLPLMVRISCTDWTPEGWTLDDSVQLARLLAEDGADAIDCSSGGNVPHARIPTGPCYQVPFAARIKRDAGVITAAVGLITEPAQADAIVREEQADLIALARAELRDPYWARRAAGDLGCETTWPPQYERARL